MGRASSAKKVARAARAGGGGSTRSTRERSIIFPTAVAIVCVLGLALVIYARATLDDDAEAEAPLLSDHWHGALGIYTCDEFQPDFEATEDPDGIHSHQDGIIHIHPFSNRVTGEDARFEVFLDAMGATVTDDEINLGDGTTFVEGEDQCDGEDAIVQLATWANADEAADTDPIIITENIAEQSFENDRFAWTLAFAPRGADIPPPESIPGLDNLSDVIDPTAPTTVPGAADPSSATTVAPDPSTATTTP